MGYRLSNVETEGDISILNVFDGEGGVNKAFFSVGFKALKYFSFGATLNYNFGQIIHETGRYQDDISLGTILENKSSISGVDFKFSTHLEIPVFETMELQALFSYAPQANLTSTNSQIFMTRGFNSTSSFGENLEGWQIAIELATKIHIFMEKFLLRDAPVFEALMSSREYVDKFDL